MNIQALLLRRIHQPASHPPCPPIAAGLIVTQLGNLTNDIDVGGATMPVNEFLETRFGYK